MNKIIGLITAWAAEPFIEPAIKQAIEYCDEVIVSVGVHHPSLKKYGDNTLKICENYKDKITLLPSIPNNNHLKGRTNTLQKMLNSSKYYKKDNWLWILDSDEFYFEEDVKRIKEIIDLNQYSSIELPEKIFMVNTNYYVTNKRCRIKKIVNDNTKFIHNNRIGVEDKNKFYMNTDLGIFHYTFLLNPYVKKDMWKIEYGNPQKNKMAWLDMYLDLELNNQKKSVEFCKNKFNKNSICGIHNFGSKNNGELFNYNGKHPKFIEEAELTKIKDFRKIYHVQ